MEAREYTLSQSHSSELQQWRPGMKLFHNHSQVNCSNRGQGGHSFTITAKWTVAVEAREGTHSQLSKLEKWRPQRALTHSRVNWSNGGKSGFSTRSCQWHYFQETAMTKPCCWHVNSEHANHYISGTPVDPTAFPIPIPFISCTKHYKKQTAILPPVKFLFPLGFCHFFLLLKPMEWKHMSSWNTEPNTRRKQTWCVNERDRQACRLTEVKTSKKIKITYYLGVQ